MNEKTQIEFTTLRPADKFCIIQNMALPYIKFSLRPFYLEVFDRDDLGFAKVLSRVLDALGLSFAESQVT